MNKVIFLSEQRPEQNSGIQILSNDRTDWAETLTKFSIPEILKSRNIRTVQTIFIKNSPSMGIDWGFIEFLNITDDQTLEIIELINKRYGKEIYSGEVLLETPSRELLIELELL